MSDDTPKSDPAQQPANSDDREHSTSISEETDHHDASAPLSGMVAEPVPEQIGRYRIVRVLGEGGFGRVLLAKDDRLEKLVAIKLAKGGEFGSQSAADAYLAEARSLARIEHPNIVPVYDVQVEGTRPYIVMKYVEGVTFDEWVTQHQPTTRDIVEALVAICEALGFAHRQALVHRDLKPGNILVDGNGRPHVTDFGLALDFGDRGEWQGHVAGTLSPTDLLIFF